ncbi:hypothetical protein VQH23_26470 (plasmid) [Pararoseomonas sp. SCSIO 73927]|uniref:hypothetical protein n=1 Tax=Pararoseomonas sp. SCSIO 73927 TaxID=3114537 RepID=UPI0030D32E59
MYPPDEAFRIWAAGLTGPAADLLQEALQEEAGCGPCGGDGSTYDGRAEAWRRCHRCGGSGQEPIDYAGIRAWVERSP